MATFQTVAEIENAIKTGLREAAPFLEFAVKEELKKAIDEQVYSWPPGTWYRRRYSASGLGDTSLFNSKKGRIGKFTGTYEDSEGFLTYGTDPNTLSITITVQDDAEPDGGKTSYRLDDMVEKGIGRGNMSFPRPFYRYADQIVQQDEGMLTEIVTDIINAYL